ncbi:MAG: hypothetical protein V9G19_02450 [Tetrasphaera sp.]
MRTATGISPATVPHRTPGWQLAPYADHSAAFVFSSAPVGVHVLDRLTWLVLELCDGRSAGEITEHARTVLGERPDATEIVDGRIGRLLEAELITLESRSPA